MTHDFYTSLPALDHFERLADADAYTPVPDDWTVVLTDVVGSTVAVQAGRYRDVNYVGAASIAAVLNAAGRADVPFVFGGDGATLVLPPALVDPALASLAALQRHAATRLSLQLRVGSVRVSEIRAAGHDLTVARLQVAPGYAQALLSGGGLGWAEDQIKGATTAERYASHAAPAEDADPYAGLECRWEDVMSPHGETVSLLVAATAGPGATEVYHEVLAAVEEIYGSGEAAHPVSLDRLRLSTSAERFDSEVRLRQPDRHGRYRAELWLRNVLGRFLVRRGVRTSGTDWAAYPTLLRASTDYRKFDGVLRMILAGTPDQRARLEATLDAGFEAGRLAYGLHVSDRAILTCLVYERMGQQVHFVDGAGGGYTSAAVPFKRRVKELAARAGPGGARPGGQPAPD
ncbi:MAG TPA: DUF3095 domain-containing protein [Rubricoccaceae bacterium]